MGHFSTSGMLDYKGHTWRASGYEGCDNTADFIGSLKGRIAIIAGSAAGVFDEVNKALEYFSDQAVLFGVNDVGMFLPNMEHWVSLHSDQFPTWKAVRQLHAPHRSGPEHVKCHGVDPKHEVDYAWELLTPIMPLSGYFAAQIAYVGGADEIILCGCPGEPSRRFFEAAPRIDYFGSGSGPTPLDEGVRQQLINEMNRLPDFKARVHSMSGWTREYFGYPTKYWRGRRARLLKGGHQ